MIDKILQDKNLMKDLVKAGIDDLAADSAVKEYELLLQPGLKLGAMDYIIL